MAVYQGLVFAPMEGNHIMDYLTIIALLSVVLIGLPHGAMDGAVPIAMGYGQSI